jgi:CubicO group peptidase (beta-lactamase class C family)
MAKKISTQIESCQNLLFAIGLASFFFSSTSIADNQSQLSEQVDKLFNEVVSPGAPGCAVGIYKDNKMLYSQGYGLANIENNVPITPKSVFDIGSTSKQFTAASIVKLEQQGKLSLADDIRKYLPEIPKYDKKITIKHLLNHTSGLRDYIYLMLWSGFDIDDVTTDHDALNLIKRQKNLNFTPGSEHLYSNTGYFLASLIVERVSGKTLKDFAQETIFTPLKMTSTGYINSHTSLVKNRAAAYSKDKEGEYRRNVSYWEQNGDGAVFTTVEDLMLWDAIFYSNTSEYLTLKKALYQKGKLNDGNELNYALGLIHSKHKGLELIEHGGSWGGYRAQMIRIPTHKLSVSTLCNIGKINSNHMATQVVELYLAEHLVENSEIKPNDKDLETANVYEPIKLAGNIFEKYSGKYEFVDYPGEVIELIYKDNVFSLNTNFEPVANLVGASDDIFVNDKGQARIAFQYDNKNSLDKIIYYGSTSKLPYQLNKVVPYSAVKKEVESIVGEYYSEELNLSYQVKYFEDQFKAFDRSGKAIALSFLDKDRLLTDNPNFKILDIHRDSSGNFEKFSISSGRVKNIFFSKRNVSK